MLGLVLLKSRLVTSFFTDCLLMHDVPNQLYFIFWGGGKRSSSSQSYITKIICNVLHCGENEQMNGQSDRRKDGQSIERSTERMNERINERMNEWTRFESMNKNK